MGLYINLLVAIALALMTACGHKPTNPVSIAQPGDSTLSCAEIEGQMLANRKAANTLAGLDSERESVNTAAMVTSAVIFWPAVFAVDLSNKEQIEMRALQDRNANLASLHKKKTCPSG